MGHNQTPSNAIDSCPGRTSRKERQSHAGQQRSPQKSSEGEAGLRPGQTARGNKGDHRPELHSRYKTLRRLKPCPRNASDSDGPILEQQVGTTSTETPSNRSVDFGWEMGRRNLHPICVEDGDKELLDTSEELGNSLRIDCLRRFDRAAISGVIYEAWSVMNYLAS